MYVQTRDNFMQGYCLKGNIRNVKKVKVTLVFDKKNYITQKKLLLKNPFFMFLVNFIFS